MRGVGAKTLLGAPGLTSNKKLLETRIQVELKLPSGQSVGIRAEGWLPELMTLFTINIDTFTGRDLSVLAKVVVLMTSW